MRILSFCILTLFASYALSSQTPSAEFYRNLTQKVRAGGAYKVFMPDGRDMQFSYHFEFDEPMWKNPQIVVSRSRTDNPDFYYVSFWDKIFLKEGSYLQLANEKIPLTCVYVDGQDNRFSGNNSPLFPQFLMKVYIVANDFSCTGPLNPGWPANGGRNELWDTYLYFEIRDTTIMLPIENKLRYRWNEFSSVLMP